MRFLLLIKWAAILVLMFLAVVLAAPLFVAFMCMDQKRTSDYLETMGDWIQFYIKADFDRLKFRR